LLVLAYRSPGRTLTTSPCRTIFSPAFCLLHRTGPHHAALLNAPPLPPARCPRCFCTSHLRSHPAHWHPRHMLCTRRAPRIPAALLAAWWGDESSAAAIASALSFPASAHRHRCAAVNASLRAVHLAYCCAPVALHCTRPSAASSCFLPRLPRTFAPRTISAHLRTSAHAAVHASHTKAHTARASHCTHCCTHCTPHHTHTPH